MVLRIERNADADMFFKCWEDYLTARGGLAGDVSLCRVLNVNTEDLRKQVTAFEAGQKKKAKAAAAEADAAGRDTAALDREIEEKDAVLTRALKRAAFPWITPVLGSGCLRTPDEIGGFSVTELPAALARAARGWGSVFPGGDDINEVVFEFSANLVKSRNPHVREHRFPGVDELPDDASQAMGDPAMSARAALAAALLTQLFHRVASLASQPVADSHARLVLSSDYQEYGDIREQVIDPLLVHLKKFAQEAKKNPKLKFLTSHLKLVVEEVGQDTVTLADAEMLTEITWHLMTRDTEQYAGWTDLIFHIGMQSGIKAGTYSPDRRWPFLTNLGDQTGLRAWLKDGLEKTTQRSWKARLASDEPTARERFYDAIAEVLFEQARLDKEFLPKDEDDDEDDDAHDDEEDWNDPSPNVQFPPSVAYVTSFDLELEMALLDLGSPFVLVAPFEVWRGTGEGRRSSLVWFYRIVSAESPVTKESLDTLRGKGSWKILLAKALSDTSSDIAGLPIVVRLTGCPLVERPVIDESTNRRLTTALQRPLTNAEKKKALNGAAQQDPTDDFEISHAALLDEHTGLHHWTAEVRELIQLPRELVGNRTEPANTENMDRRFWLLLGVQIPDDAVRHRVASLVAAESLRGYVPNAACEAKYAGVVINRRSEPAQRDILQWLGLDVVEGEHTVVIDALQHYCRHLADPDLELRPIGHDECGLGANDATLEVVR